MSRGSAGARRGRLPVRPRGRADEDDDDDEEVVEEEVEEDECLDAAVTDVSDLS
jgi:hypothetical protein